MASIGASVIVLLLVAPLAVYGATFEVQWSLSEDYSAWPSMNISIGDEMVFTYTPAHNVYVVSNNSCDTSNSTFFDKSGSTKYTLTKPGPLYFICGVPGHCPPMKLQVNVDMAGSSSSTPSPPASSTSPAPPTTSKGSGTGAAPTARAFSWLLVIGGSLVFAALLA